MSGNWVDEWYPVMMGSVFVAQGVVLLSFKRGRERHKNYAPIPMCLGFGAACLSLSSAFGLTGAGSAAAVVVGVIAVIAGLVFLHRYVNVRA